MQSLFILAFKHLTRFMRHLSHKQASRHQTMMPQHYTARDRERPATSTAWALDDSGTAGIWVCGGWIGRDESQQSTDARETGSHDPDNRAKGESSPMRH
jgi:hypothetical protein